MADAPVDFVDELIAGFGDGDPAADDASVARSDLADEIYAQLHCRLPAELHARDARGGERIDGREFFGQLSQANTGRGSWQSPWTVRALEPDGRVVAESMGVRFWCAPPEVRGARPLAVGDRVQVFIPAEYRQLIPGFYMATGDADDVDGAPLVRVYWSVRARGAAALLSLITRDLNAAGVPFRFKVPIDPRDFGRADAAVLYLRRELAATAAPLLARITETVRTELGDATSAFVKRLAPGVGMAEDPGGETSFGQHRSRMLADALASAPVRAAPRRADRAAAVRDFVRAAGYDPAAFHLQPGATDDYPWPTAALGD